jgi:AcrR family transcriptional regulator
MPLASASPSCSSWTSPHCDHTQRLGVSEAQESTPDRLISAAERLFAERGVDGVSLREINRASGARNTIALQYHFDDRAGLVRAIFDKHQPDVESRRHALLDQYEAAGQPDLRVLAGALVRPLAAKLADPDGGPAFLQIYAEVLSRPPPSMDAVLREDPITSSVNRWRALMETMLEADAVRLHRRFTAIVHSAVELGRRARSGPHTDDRLFTSYLVDITAAILSAPTSEETRRLANERDAATTVSATERN